jgi:hypothetical protein
VDTKPRTRKTNTPLELRLFDALIRIASYDPPGRLHQSSRREFGIDGAEAIEMAYENVIEKAKRATKGLRIGRP